nr:polysaccharide deacetylase family protein [uncultured Bacteroides sp.]
MNKQIFQTDNKSRWNGFKWSARFLLFILILLIAIFLLALVIDKNPPISLQPDYKSAVMATKPFMQENKLSREYKGFRDRVHVKKAHSDYEKVRKERVKRDSLRNRNFVEKVLNKNFAIWQRIPAGIRAAFYVAWDPQSFYSLKRNIKNINLVMPEWIFIDPKTYGIHTAIDKQGFDLMRKNGVPVMPMLSNNVNGNFRGDIVSVILHSPQKRAKLIQEMLNLCLQNKFVGVNIDLEELNEEGDESLVEFVKEMAAAFHAKGLLVSQDVVPFNKDYNIHELGKYLDYLCLMAYDEYSMGGNDAGPISSQKWIEAAVDDLVQQVSSEKVILCLGAFGYDWSEKENVSLTYQEALARASTSSSSIHFDNNTYNLNYAYTDGDNVFHQVYFNDAVTHFNTMRFGSDYPLGGFSVWRLGSEDNRLWKFYRKDLSDEASANIKKSDLEKVQMVNHVDYIGEGEILDVLNTPHAGQVNIEVDSAEMLVSEENYVKIPTAYQIRKYGVAPKKELVLTFDDGPDERYTPKILDILKKYKVPGAFFLVGLQAEKNLPLVRRIYEEGHLIGNHTFTHPNIANVTKEQAAMEFKLTRLLIECITGHTTILFRAPYNADSEPGSLEEIIPLALARDQNYLDVGESIDPEDWLPGIKADTIFDRVIKGVEGDRGNIILLHDAGGETREETIKALPKIIEYFQKRGYTFTSLTSLLHESKEQLMPPIPKGEEYYIMQSNLALASFTYWALNVLTAFFILFIVLGLGRLMFMVILTIREHRKDKKRHYSNVSPLEVPLVSIIVPGYNEEVNVVSSLKNLLCQDYTNFNVIFVDDGSKDETYKRVSEAFSDHPKVQIYTKPNEGKASALNYGIAHTKAEFVVCIDADTKLYPNAISLMIRHFYQGEHAEQVGAVAGKVKVGNQLNMLTKWQAIEYTTSQNFDRMAYANINAITVVPGAIGAFRRKAIEDAGGLTTDTLAEDCDLTISILRAGYIVENENDAIAMTEAPESVKQFIKQRTRWSFGVMQTFWKHRDALFNTKHKGLGFWAMPNMLIFQFIIPTFSPLADLFMILGLFSGNAAKIGLYYLLFMLVDASVSIYAYIYEREKLYKLLWIIPQRFGYRWIMYVVLFRSYKKAIKGELQSWGVLKRSGNVADINAEQ